MKFISFSKCTTGLACFLCSCSQYPSDIESVLKQAADNQGELEKVLKYYKSNKDPRKYKTALFLISNMGNKFYYEGEILDNYMPLFRAYDSIFSAKVVNRKDKVIQKTWDRLAEKYGN